MKKHLTTTKIPPKNLDLIKSVAVRAHVSGTSIGRMSPDEVIKPVQAAILATAQRLGIKITTIEVQDLCRFTLTYFKDFNVAEIPIAFDLLNAQKFQIKSGGHFGILSASYWGEVLTAYRNYRIEETRKEQLKGSQLDPDQTRILTEEETEELNNKAMKEGILQNWKHFLEFKKMPVTPSMDFVSQFHYDYLRDNGIMGKPEEEELESIKAEAKEYISEDLKNRQLNSSRSERKSLAMQITQITGTDKFKATCKKIGVRIFFENLIFEEQDLEKIINNYEK
jgi:hypothetical protein